MGFDWGPFALAVGALLGAWLSTGLMRGVLLGAALLAAAYMGYQYWTWNRPGWRRVHYRAMLAYSGIVERERVLARQSGGRFDPASAHAQLGLLLCGEENRAAIDTMLTDLTRTKGIYLASLVERYGGEVVPGMPFELRRDLIANLRNVPLGPQVVIAAVIENIYGGREAARYAVAVATGDAA